MKKSLVVAALSLLLGGSAWAAGYNEKFVGPKRTKSSDELTRMALTGQIGITNSYYTGSATFYTVSVVQEADGSYSLQTNNSASSTKQTVDFGGATPPLALTNTIVGVRLSGDEASSTEWSAIVSSNTGYSFVQKAGTTFLRISKRPGGASNAAMWVNYATPSTSTYGAAGNGGLASDSIPFVRPAMTGWSGTVFLWPSDAQSGTVHVEATLNGCQCQTQ